MQGQSFPDFSRANGLGPPTSFPEPNVPGLARGGYPSRYHDAPEGADGASYQSDPTYAYTFPQASVPRWPQPRMPEEYDTYQASKQPPPSRSHSTHSEYVQVYSVRSANESYPPSSESSPLGSMTAMCYPPQGPANVQDGLEGSYLQVAGYPMAASESPSGSFMLDSLDSLDWPSAPQEYDLSGEHNLPPLMPDPQPFYRDTGRRRALAIGINYSMHPNPKLKLKKCIEDAYGMANFLRDKLDFAHEDVRLMTDNHPWDHPTEKNILEAMRALVHDARPHDHLVFYFSGHALQVKDLSGYKSLAECICAVDYRNDDPNPNANTRGLIVDNIMHELMVKSLPPQCRLTAIFDSCHSGTLLDLPYVYDSNGKVKPFRRPEILEILRQRSSHANVVSLSASKDEQVALETEQGGALRMAFIGCVETFGSSLTYRELLHGVRDYMKSHKFKQRPQLSSSHEIDTNILFTT